MLTSLVRGAPDHYFNFIDTLRDGRAWRHQHFSEQGMLKKALLVAAHSTYNDMMGGS